MKRANRNKRLTLDRETVRRLDAERLRLAGGFPYTMSVYTCPGCSTIRETHCTDCEDTVDNCTVNFNCVPQV